MSISKLIELADYEGDNDTVKNVIGAVAVVGIACFGYSATVKSLSVSGTRGVIEQTNYMVDTGITTVTFHAQ